MPTAMQPRTVSKNPPIILSDIVLTPDSEGNVTIRSQISPGSEMRIYIDDLLRTEPIRVNPATGEWTIRLPLESGTYILRIEDSNTNSVETDLVVLDPPEN